MADSDFWIFQCTHQGRTDNLLQSGPQGKSTVGGTVEWLWSTNLKQRPAIGDVVFFLRSGSAPKNYTHKRPWRGITGFGTISGPAVQFENAQSKLGVSVDTIAFSQENPLPDWKIWHDHRVAKATRNCNCRITPSGIRGSPTSDGFVQLSPSD